MLSGYTREGSVIEVDTRLRPHGSDGELVASVRQLGQYFESEAEAWEALAFGKLRWVAGDERLASAAAERLTGLKERFAGAREFVPELRAMRQRIADSGGADSFKTGAGGLYDLDFILGMLEVRAGLPAAGLQMPERLEALRERGLLTAEQAGMPAECRRAVSPRGARHPGGGGPRAEVGAGERRAAGKPWRSLWGEGNWTARCAPRCVRCGRYLIRFSMIEVRPPQW